MNPDRLIEEALEQGCFTGAAAEVFQGDRSLYRRTAGTTGSPEEASPIDSRALWDLASLTKVLCTAPLLLHLMEAQGVEDRAPLGSLLPRAGKDLASLPLKELLCHTAGLPPVPEMFRLFPDGNCCDKERALGHLFGLTPLTMPGKGVNYSCTGFILLGLAAEKLGGAPLDRLFRELMARPLGASSIGYCPADKERAVYQEYDSWRGRLLRGEVHDENAWTLGGVAGNAGLFSDLDSLGRFAAFFRWEGELGGRPFLSGEHFRRLTEAQTRPGQGEPRAYGFACPYGEIFAGPGWSPRSYGHTGFTGSSFWRDPERDRTILLLTNRVRYGREETREKIRRFRREFHGLFL